MTRAEAKAAGIHQSDHNAPQHANSREDRATEIAATYKWTEPINTENVAARYYSPALAALDLPPARWHDLRHTFAVLSLSAGEHYIQVSKMCGHASFVTTLNVYADYIPEAEGGKQAPLTRPVTVAASGADVVNLRAGQ